MAAWQNKVIALDQYYPKEVTAEDREAGLCTTSQFPTQDVQMISVGNPSECPSQSQDQSFSPSEAIGRRNENIREEAKESSCTKKARIFEDVDQSGLLSSGISTPNIFGDQKANTFGEVSQAVPDVASAIEDLLEQTTKVKMFLIFNNLMRPFSFCNYSLLCVLFLCRYMTVHQRVYPFTIRHYVPLFTFNFCISCNP